MIKLKEGRLLSLIAKVKGSKDVVSVPANIKELEDYIKNEMYLQARPQTGADLKHFVRLAKQLSKSNPSGYDGAFKNEEFQVITDGCYAIFIKETMECVEASEKGPKIRAIAAKQNIALDAKAIDPKDISISHKIYKKSLVGLKGLERREKEKECCKYMIGDKAFNVEYLRNITRVLGDIAAVYTGEEPLSPLTIIDSSGNMGLVLPIRLKG